MEEFQKVCDSNERMVQDIAKLGNSLNNLHSVWREGERRKFYASIAGLVLSFIPVIGSALETGASASAEILLGMNQKDLLELGTDAAKGTVNHFLSTDLSNLQSVGILTSRRFLSSLDEPTKTRVEVAIKSSKFRTVESFQKEFAQEQNVLILLKETSEIDEGMERELSNIFRVISSESKDITARISEAAPETNRFCRRWLPNFNQAEKEVRRELRKLCNRRTARLDFKAFQAAFKSNEKKYAAVDEQDKAKIELQQRFSEAVQERSSIVVGDAIIVLESLHIDSGDGDANGLSFTRTRNDWDEDEVEKMLEGQAKEDGNVCKKGFVQVGLQVLFKEGRE